MDEEALAQRLDELEAITSIYPEEAVAVPDGSALVFTAPNPSHPRHITLRFYLSESYPASSPPRIEAEALHLDLRALEKLENDLIEQWIPGEPSLFSMLSWLLENGSHLWEIGTAHPKADTAGEGDEEAEGRNKGGNRGESAPSTSSLAREELDLIEKLIKPRVVHGEIYLERKSTFQAHLCPVGSQEEVRLFMNYLLQNNKIRNATHNISAYRFNCKAKGGVLVQDCDDDGEDAAGGRLLHLLNVTNTLGVCVVVSRWFGGVLLGPSRFAIINNTARQLLEQEGFIQATHAAAGKNAKK